MRRAVMALLVMLAGCEGAAGPMGPEGPQGPQGTAGVVNSVMLTGVAGVDGEVAVSFPASVGTSATPIPLLACYVTGDPNSGAWLAVNDGYWIEDTPWCAIAFVTDHWEAAMFGVPDGWTAAFVVFY